jgi:hypothetical protein
MKWAQGRPVQEYAPVAGGGQFAESYTLFGQLAGWLAGDQAAAPLWRGLPSWRKVCERTRVVSYLYVKQ